MTGHPWRSCRCGKPPFVGVVEKSEKNKGRPYATCVDWRTDHGCKYFAWLDAPRASDGHTGQIASRRGASAGQAGQQGYNGSSGAAPATPDRPSVPQQVAQTPSPAGASTGGRSSRLEASEVIQPHPAAQSSGKNKAVGRVGQLSTATRPDVEPEGSDCFAVLSVVTTVRSTAYGDSSSIPGSSGNNNRSRSKGESSYQQQPLSLVPLCPPDERVRVVLLPASQHPSEYCTQHLARPVAPGPRLPRAPASLQSLQAPYVVLQYCPAALGVYQGLGCDLEAGGDGVGIFVVDTETTGLSGRDYVHQLALLNLHTCQLLTVLLRTCPRTIGTQAAQVCGSNNHALHDPCRPTFGQVAPLLYAFLGSDTMDSWRNADGSSSARSFAGALGGTSLNGSSSHGSSASSSFQPGSPVKSLTSLVASRQLGGALPSISGPGGVPQTSKLTSPETSGTELSTTCLEEPPPSGLLLVAHNGGFDARMLIGEFLRRGLAVPRHWRMLDTLPWARAYVSNCSDFKQATLRRRFGIALAPGQAEHDAGTDVCVLAQLLPHLLRESGARDLQDVLRMCRPSGMAIVRSFGEIMVRCLSCGGLRGLAGLRGLGFLAGGMLVADFGPDRGHVNTGTVWDSAKAVLSDAPGKDLALRQLLRPRNRAWGSDMPMPMTRALRLSLENGAHQCWWQQAPYPGVVGHTVLCWTCQSRQQGCFLRIRWGTRPRAAPILLSIVFDQTEKIISPAATLWTVLASGGAVVGRCCFGVRRARS